MCVCVSVRARVFKIVRGTNRILKRISASWRSEGAACTRLFGAIPEHEFSRDARVIALERDAASRLDTLRLCDRYRMKLRLSGRVRSEGGRRTGSGVSRRKRCRRIVGISKIIRISFISFETVSPFPRIFCSRNEVRKKSDKKRKKKETGTRRASSPRLSCVRGNFSADVSELLKLLFRSFGICEPGLRGRKMNCAHYERFLGATRKYSFLKSSAFATRALTRMIDSIFTLLFSHFR